MDTFEVTCIEKEGRSFNYVINGQDFFFRGGRPTKINDSVWNLLKSKKNSKGKPLFVKKEVEVESNTEVISEVDTSVEKTEEVKPSLFSVLDLHPPVKKNPTQKKNFNQVTKKVQGKLT